jgi:hypothetical protein
MAGHQLANIRDSKFFGKQSGTNPPPPQQSKLSFSTKSSNKPKASAVDDEADTKREDEPDGERKPLKGEKKGSKREVKRENSSNGNSIVKPLDFSTNFANFSYYRYEETAKITDPSYLFED